MGTSGTKILCHPLSGEPFCVWHRAKSAYACYFSSGDQPPAPELLGIKHSGITDMGTLVWKPVVQVVGDPDKDVQVYGEYDDDTGETV